MSPDTNAARLILSIDAGEGAAAEELDRLTRQLCDEIQELEVESVELVKGEAPEGTKSAEAVTLGALALAVMPTAVPQLIEFLKSWSMRGESRTVKVKAQVGDRSLDIEYNPATMSPTELKSLVDTLTETLTKKK